MFLRAAPPTSHLPDHWKLRLLLLPAILCAVLLMNISSSAAQEPVGSIKIARRSVAEGVGLSWGDGVLSFGGRDYPFTFQARGLLRGVDARMAAEELSGEVFNLERPEDFSGNYQKVVAEARSGEVSRATVTNQNRVVITLISAVEGRKFNLGPDGMDIELKK